MNRSILIQQLVDKLAKLEAQREAIRMSNISYNQDNVLDGIDADMKEIRIKLQNVMNSVCPLIKD